MKAMARRERTMAREARARTPFTAPGLQLARARASARARLEDEYDALMHSGDDLAQAGLEETDPVTRTGRMQLETDPRRAAARLIIGSMGDHTLANLTDSESEDIAGALRQPRC